MEDVNHHLGDLGILLALNRLGPRVRAMAMSSDQQGWQGRQEKETIQDATIDRSCYEASLSERDESCIVGGP